jgi:F-type H+-transporting ATPase subunit delta
MNSSERIAVERYAKAYDSLSKTGEQAHIQAHALQTAAEALSCAGVFMASPKVSGAQKKELVLSCLKDYPAVANFMVLLLDARRYHLLAAIVGRVTELAQARLGIKQAEVFSATELTPRVQAQTEQALSARYGGKVEAVFKVQQELLGGLKIICDGELIDGSLLGKLKKLERELSR